MYRHRRSPVTGKPKRLTFPESRLAHNVLAWLSGIEIGGAAHNSFGLKTFNICNDDHRELFRNSQLEHCGRVMPIDVIAEGDELPFADESWDFVISSHVLEHFYDPIRALKEWHRVVKPDGFIFAIIPHMMRTFDSGAQRTTLQELIQRHETFERMARPACHYSFWITADVVELIGWLGWKLHSVQDVDDKVGNGFTIVIQKG